MAVKPINELAPRTPSATDVLAVADPFNGQTGKSTAAQILNTGAQLTAKSPALQDTVIVNDATTGVAGKTVIEAIRTGAKVAERKSSVTFTPTIPNQYVEGFLSTVTGTTPTSPLSSLDGVLPFYYANNPSSGTNYALIGNQSGDVRLSTIQITISGQTSSSFSSVSAFTNLQTFSAPDTEFFYFNFNSCTKLESILFPNAKKVQISLNQSARFLTQLSSSTVEYLYVETGFQSSAISTVSFPECVKCGAITFQGSSNSYGMPNLATFNFPKLKYATNGITVTGAPLLTNISLPELEVCQSLNLNPNYVQTISLPKLRNCFNGGLLGNNYLALTSFNAPLLERTQASPINGGSGTATASYPVLTSINLPSFKNWGVLTYTYNNNDVSQALGYTIDGYWVFGINNAPLLTTINLPSLEIASGQGSVSFNISGAPNLTTFTVKQNPLLYLGNFICTGAALNQASVDGILVALAYMDGVNNAPYPAWSSKTVNLSGGTSATPSATGLAAKATLVARGCTVTHN